MNDEQRCHLIDLLEIRISSILINKDEARMMSGNQKHEAIMFDKTLILLLQEGMKNEN